MAQKKSNKWGPSLFLLARGAIMLAFIVRFDVFTINIDDNETFKNAIMMCLLTWFLFLPEIWHSLFPKGKKAPPS